MKDLSEISNILNNEILKNFAFFIPFELIDNSLLLENLELFNIQITQDFVDNYVDQFLYIDDTLQVRKVESYKNLQIANAYKIVKLNKNCFEIVQLKDSLGVESFNFLYNSYTDRINSLLNGYELMITHYDKLYPESSITPKEIIMMQEATLQYHLIEIEEKIGIKSQITNIDNVIKDVILSKLFSQFTEKKEVEIIPFRDFIRHDNKIEIEKIIKEHFSDLRGVSLRYLIEFLEEKEIILILYGDKTKIHRSIKLLFGNKDIGNLTSIFDLKICKSADTKYKKAKEHFIEIFKNVI